MATCSGTRSKASGHSLRDLRSIQDWFVRYQLNAVPGVAEVASIGGHVQQYQIDVDPNRLRAYNLSLGDVVEAVRDSNQNVGGNVLEANGTWSIVRGVGLIESVEDLEQIVVGASGGVPVYVHQVGEVRVGDAFRVASLVKGSDEAVGGVIVARTGANAQQVIDGVKARIAQISPGLPAGVRIVPFYDRSTLIAQAVDTLRITLLEEIALVTLAHVVFLMHLRSILVVTLPLPLAVLISFLGMYYAGISSNIMSLAGIAIAIGVLVDAGIVVTENAFRQVERSGIDVRDRRAVWRAVLESTRLVGRPVFFSMAIIVLAFVPVFALTGQAGKLFQPLAFTKTFAVLAATRARRHAGAGALHAASRRQAPRRGGQSGDAGAAPHLPPVARGGALAPMGRRSPAPPCCSPARWWSGRASAASSCRRSTRATCSSCRSRTRASRSSRTRKSPACRTRR